VEGREPSAGAEKDLLSRAGFGRKNIKAVAALSAKSYAHSSCALKPKDRCNIPPDTQFRG